jgi:hypothetical protein
MSGFLHPFIERSRNECAGKLTEHEVAEVAAPEIIISSDRSPLTFPAGDQYL